MKNKNFTRLYMPLIIGLVLLFAQACKKETNTTNPIQLPVVTTTAMVSSIGITSAISGGTVTSQGGAIVQFRGVCWSTSPNPTILNAKTADSIGTGTFTSILTGLKTNTTYYVRAYANNSAGTAYGSAINFTTTSVVVGNSYEGGVVAYVLQAGDSGYIAGEVHGIIAAPADQSGGIQWYNGINNVVTGATSHLIGFGRANTDSIVRVQGTGSYAAKLCYDLVLYGYSDWYLPSSKELLQLYLNRVAIGGFVNNDYWSSTEDTPGWAWAYVFNTGYTNVWQKYSTFAVRPVRSF